MAAQQGRQPRVVAELGRPETAEETAARKAENSRRHRANQTLRNLLLALGASLLIVLFLVFVVVRPDQPTLKPVDYQKVAAEAQVDAPERLIAPELPAGWSANAADLRRGADDIQAWNIGFITPSDQYIGFTQGIDVNDTWISNQVQKARSTGTTTAGDIEWKVYDRRDADEPGNYAYAMTLNSVDVGLVLHGTATTKEFRTLAAAVARQLGEAGE